ncbi:MAG TPA: sigma-54-dependent Fis family transcriptional regulator, partial [Desulfosalsimonadaceae bacterium]|nr:sigma-54-dependent Fis family transcriptional regulator [Desulfosalsimonadaceae bacterium]
MNVDQNVFFREATVRICSSLDIEIALKRMQRYVSRFIPAQFMSLGLMDPHKNVLRRIAGTIARAAEGMGGEVALPDSKEMRAKWIKKHVELEEFMLVNRLEEEDPDLFELFWHLGFDPDISFIMIRLELEGNRIGGLWISTTGRNQYSVEQARLLRILHEPVAIAMSNALRHQEVVELNRKLTEDIRYLHDQLHERASAEIIGAEGGLRRVTRMAGQVAGLDSPVLILGETGVGKELIANYIHYSSHRRNGPLVKVNCGAIPESLMDSELFGHEKGAFTGALERKRGRFERAERGTIFLDEVGELSQQAQVRLLRVLQEKTIERVGGTQEIAVDVRIVSATNRNLQDMVAAGEFREDLWFRLNVFPVEIPPLRERKEDIPALVEFFLQKKSRDLKLKEPPELQEGAINQLLAHDWPGNIRELENLVERALIQYQGGRISFAGLVREPSRFNNTSGPLASADRTPTLDEVMAAHIRQVLAQCNGKISGPGGAAELLGVHYSTLRNRMRKLGIDFGRKNAARS